MSSPTLASFLRFCSATDGVTPQDTTKHKSAQQNNVQYLLNDMAAQAPVAPKQVVDGGHACSWLLLRHRRLLQHGMLLYFLHSFRRKYQFRVGVTKRWLLAPVAGF